MNAAEIQAMLALRAERYALRESLNWALGYLEWAFSGASRLVALPESEDSRALLRAKKLLEEES